MPAAVTFFDAAVYRWDDIALLSFVDGELRGTSRIPPRRCRLDLSHLSARLSLSAGAARTQDRGSFGVAGSLDAGASC